MLIVMHEVHSLLSVADNPPSLLTTEDTLVEEGCLSPHTLPLTTYSTVLPPFCTP